MRPEEQRIWKSEALDQVFRALASAPDLADKLVYKGARVLALHLPAIRQSFDIDSTMTVTFTGTVPNVAAQAALLEKQLRGALVRYFERQDPVRFTLADLRMNVRTHPRGWNSLFAAINIADNQRANVIGLPQLTIDISAPETLLPTSVVEIPLNGGVLRAYSLSRVAGEKLRAYLTSLPAYREKMKRPTEAIRVRDLYDLATILKHRPITDRDFWAEVAQEFTVACESRAVDCLGLVSFLEAWETARVRYEEPGIFPPDISFAQAEAALRTIVDFLETVIALPLRFEIPDRVS